MKIIALLAKKNGARLQAPLKAVWLLVQLLINQGCTG
jgi:hypothetical protein